ncbi:MAG: Maf family nucleotide pyrophosphatase [Lactobacillales bacterium]|jgi:septum formation protein|nr:Maf family nucleotide pyrophosphatase [Lactobacillales bacterium]
MKIILASKSPARARVLTLAGIAFETSVSNFDEQTFLASIGDLSFAEQVRLLAIEKARVVATEFPDDFVIACDSSFEFEGELLGKPKTVERARATIERYSGRTGELHTGHALIYKGEVRSMTKTSFIEFAEFSESELEAYLATGESLEVAGGFTIDGYGGCFIKSITGDYQNIVGISLIALNDLLKEFGRDITEFWK